MNFRGDPSNRAGRTAVVVDLTALIDVVFLLLIFFLLTSSYVSQDGRQAPQVPIELPESSLEAQQEPHDDYTIIVDSSGQIFVEKDEKVSLQELAVRLTRTRDKNPKTVVLVRGDQNVPYGRIAEVMTIVRATRLPISAVLRGGE